MWAAYTPYLHTDMGYLYEESGVAIEDDRSTASPSWDLTRGGIVVTYTGAETPSVKVTNGTAGNPVTFELDGAQLTIRDVNGKAGTDVVSAWTVFATGSDPGGFTVTGSPDATEAVPHKSNSFVDLAPPDSSAPTMTLGAAESTETALYQLVKTAVSKQRVTLPPSSALAGIYAAVDRDRGVWKAPANVSVSGVIGPTKKITHGEQEHLNVDPTAGKSINAIRYFTGKGTLVWGARTLAGNDNEWRYVPVRRLFNMIEESTQKATAFAVFEPNDATTWLKVKGMIDSYLYGLWERGALAGSSPESAYFVNVGLGQTMTPQDILEGRMVVEIGVAAVRPAEFIILRFTHKLQEA